MAACAGPDRSLTLEVEERVGGGPPRAVGGMWLESANQRLTLRARACVEDLAATEVRASLRLGEGSERTPPLKNAALSPQEWVQRLSSEFGNKLVRRIKALQDLLFEVGQQVKQINTFKKNTPSPTAAPPPHQPFDSRLLEDLTSASPQEVPGHGAPGPSWRDGALHRFLAGTLPHVLGLLQQASLLGQQELRSESTESGGRGGGQNSSLFCFIDPLQRQQSHLI